MRDHGFRIWRKRVSLGAPMTGYSPSLPNNPMRVNSHATPRLPQPLKISSVIVL